MNFIDVWRKHDFGEVSRQDRLEDARGRQAGAGAPARLGGT